MDKDSDYYADLDLPRDATPEEIRRAYKQLARRFHPDINIEAKATENFIKIQAAYEVLSDPKLRADYDKALPPEEQPPDFYQFSTLYSRSSLRVVDEPQLVYALLDLSSPKDGFELPSPPLNVCIILDRSTSMQGERMDMVKFTAIEIIRQLKADDILSLVTFSDRAEVLIPASYRTDKRFVETTIQMIKPGGATEIYQGLLAGFQEVKYNFSKQRINHMILITDGRTYGDEAACLELAEQAASYGVGISGMGIGSDWNDLFLDSLASRTGGASTYISKPADIKGVLLDKFQGLGNTYAEDVRYDFTLYKDAKIRYAFRLSPEVSTLPSEPPILFGNLPVEEHIKVLFEIEVPPLTSENGGIILANGRITAEIPSKQKSTTVRRVRLSRPVENELSSQPLPPELLNALSRLTLYRMQERVHEEIEDGKIENAVLHLQNLATNLFSQGERQLAETVLREAENVQWEHKLSEAGKKEIKYATRALLLPAYTPLE